ncbi:glycosyl hydrolase [Aquibacillus kalidii]|uniref:glycosyl hydrolase n=1 Tax=Aquibacillus kalidii TaxID=2762597 RepID=UPI0016477D1E|nr:glycosyl hydrolase [Aquibacillus kalidii]
MRKVKKFITILFVAVLIFSSWPMGFRGNSVSAAVDSDMNLVDSQASDYTRALFDYFRDNSGQQILFGQQHAIDEGLTLTNAAPRIASEQSEVKNAVGDYPAVFGWDTGSIYGREKPGVEGNVEQSIENVAASMEKAHELGGIITLSMHPLNFVTGGNYNDTTGSVVENILPGGSKHAEFNVWLDNLATLADSVEDGNGNAIPIIFRPFHEQDGSWFWWGASTTTTEQYKAIFRYTVEYLRDEKDVHNILYGYSPGGGYGGDVDRYMRTYPGDEYVDIIGVDSYDDKGSAGSDSWINGVVKDLGMLVDLATEKGKIAALTEYGYSAQGINESGNTLDWYTRLLDAIKADDKARNIAYMQTWANFGWPNNMYVPYKDVNGDLGGDHELLPNFIKFEADAFTAFRDEVKGQIFTAEHIDTKVATESPVVNVASPVSGSTIKAVPTTIRVRVLNDTPSNVVYVEEGSDLEHELTLDDHGYYSAEWTPSASVNGGVTYVTVKVIKSSGDVETKELKLFVKASEISIKKYTFDENIGSIKTNGTWPDAEVTAFEHATINGDGKVKFQVSGMGISETWQELKLELTDLTDVNLSKVNRVKFETLLPVSVGTEGASVRGVVQLPPDWTEKFGQNSTIANVADLEMVTVEGVDYYKYPVSVDLTDQTLIDNANSLAISLVGSGLDLTEAIYIDNIELLNSYVEAPENPLLVDDFEGYMGDDTLLSNSYSSNGDSVPVSMSEEFKNSGNYGMKFDFTVGSMGYGGRQTSLGGVDWTGTNAFQLWLKNESLPGNELTIQIKIGGVSFEAQVDLEQTHEEIITIPYSDFAPAHWESNQSAIIDAKRLKNVAEFALYSGGNQVESSIYLDDLQAVRDENAPDVPSAPDIEDDPKEVEPLNFSFESDLEGFAGGNAIIEEGNAKLTVALGEGAKSEFKKTKGYNLEGYNFVVASLKYDNTGTIGENPLFAKLFIKTGGDWAWTDSGEVSINADGYTNIEFDITELAVKDSVQEIGIEFFAPAGTEGVTNVYIDYIQIVSSLEEVVKPETENPGSGSSEEPETENPGSGSSEEPETENPGSGSSEEPETESPGTGSSEQPQTDGIKKLGKPVKEVVVNESTLVRNDTSEVYSFEQVAKRVKISKGEINKLESGYKIQLTNGNVTALLPVSLIKGKGNIEFIFGEVTEKVANKNKDALSQIIDFRLLSDGKEITNFNDNPITLTFKVNPDKVNNWEDLKVVFIDGKGVKKEFITPVSYNKKTGEVVAEVEHFSTYGVFEIADDLVGNSGNDQLPDTATSQFNWIVLGLLMLVFGGIAFLLTRKKKLQN